MFCTNCGSERPNDTSPCPSCGLPAMPLEPPPPLRPHVPNYLAMSVIVTICCCLPLGIPAIVYAAQVNGKLQAGDVNGAIEASNKARMWVVIAFIGGAVAGILYGLFSVAAGL